jgi:hypothetical protein
MRIKLSPPAGAGGLRPPEFHGMLAKVANIPLVREVCAPVRNPLVDLRQDALLLGVLRPVFGVPGRSMLTSSTTVWSTAESGCAPSTRAVIRSRASIMRQGACAASPVALGRAGGTPMGWSGVRDGGRMGGIQLSLEPSSEGISRLDYRICPSLFEGSTITDRSPAEPPRAAIPPHPAMLPCDRLYKDNVRSRDCYPAYFDAVSCTSPARCIGPG